MRTRNRPNKSTLIWPSWRYGPDGQSGVFNSEDEVPMGWSRKPGDFQEPIIIYPTYLDRHELIETLTNAGVEVHASWSASHMKELVDNL